MLYPIIHCTSTREICHATVGEGEINAAASMTALVLSPVLDLRQTYFLFTGIAGVNPKLATLGGVALARYTVQVALQYELDARSLPSRTQRQAKHVDDKGDWPSGYFAYGTDFPLEYPRITYGSEVFELNAALRERAYAWSTSANLSDADGPRSYRQLYSLPTSTSLTTEEEATQEENPYRAAVGPPRVVLCDAATSDVYYSGTLLAETFENTTSVWTNGTGAYCMTAQEDNANMEVMVRAAIEGLVDFARIIVMRTGEFDYNT
jgi:purine nucleoside permease